MASSSTTFYVKPAKFAAALGVSLSNKSAQQVLRLLLRDEGTIVFLPWLVLFKATGSHALSVEPPSDHTDAVCVSLSVAAGESTVAVTVQPADTRPTLAFERLFAMFASAQATDLHDSILHAAFLRERFGDKFQMPTYTWLDAQVFSQLTADVTMTDLLDEISRIACAHGADNAFELAHKLCLRTREDVTMFASGIVARLFEAAAGEAAGDAAGVGTGIGAGIGAGIDFNQLMGSMMGGDMSALFGAAGAAGPASPSEEEIDAALDEIEVEAGETSAAPAAAAAADVGTGETVVV